ncbi:MULTISPECIES: aromatic-ring-hydroxylating dioxygenase subunit beta [unclassified Oceanobacter]|uniref:aromatic-ring-hydroxylating dioxygenase subunit beta n=1 Tax=unclassified Oceanobacter TaxID=2620260 RepID=UPI0026E1B12E|nr:MULTISPECIES: aromatic-ring-hydroxylating dioxygenase subunit beta [unclassified Oceanobacter]MDO6683264.1 aromatic-ring-hydroxylating dioxygenase subunit beta [Oceanobacter sp. 5_MG-2023]MDP2610215.1 aromatic-ring-hydroxylating dioxygenase subunit beta [Oceanobacter sp. 1_MG-2023]MDP2613481.1 aromatic-ring-hydroxylating dioxygenase subunit beta [Oceanobacter sp. 2_MG-2023]
MKSNTELLAKVTEFIGYEADLLDHKGYQEWLSLWTDSGLYIVPTDLNETDYLNTLNLALDDADMRRMRVARLINGESVSADSVGYTVRMMSRIRVLEASDDVVVARCAMTLNELRHGKLVTYPANIEYRLVPTDEGFLVDRKVVKLLHADGFLRTVSFIF